MKNRLEIRQSTNLGNEKRMEGWEDGGKEKRSRRGAELHKEGERRLKDIKKLREERGLSVYRLSKLSGISPGTIKKIEEKKQSPTMYTLACIAKGLEVDLNYLMDS